MRTSNPALGEDTFTRYGTADTSNVMTVEGAAFKTMILLFVLTGVGIFTWHHSMEALRYLEPAVIEEAGRTATLSTVPANVWHMIIWPTLAAFIVAIITIFNPPSAPILAPIYAALEGACLGALSAMFEYMYPGIVPQAVGCTVGTLAALLLAYQLHLVRATENFKLGVIAATGGIAIYYLVAIGLGFFGIEAPLIHETGWMGIGFSVFVIIVAAANLVLDFDFIETGAERNAPKYLEWYAAFALLITLVWLYLEFLKLLAKLRSKD